MSQADCIHNLWWSVSQLNVNSKDLNSIRVFNIDKCGLLLIYTGSVEQRYEESTLVGKRKSPPTLSPSPNSSGFSPWHGIHPERSLGLRQSLCHPMLFSLWPRDIPDARKQWRIFSCRIHLWYDILWASCHSEYAPHTVGESSPASALRSSVNQWQLINGQYRLYGNWARALVWRKMPPFPHTAQGTAYMTISPITDINFL